MKTIKLSFRRYFLDFYLFKEKFYGDVIDIGGKKANNRGSFSPPLDEVTSWKYCNIDPEVAPDFLCSASNIPVTDSSFDVALICEVIEHLESPRDVLAEAFRVLKPGGKFIGSIPFMYPKHADPFDFQRWTDKKLSFELEKAGFKEINIYHMGGTLAVVWDMLRIKFEDPSIFNRIFRMLLRLLSFFILRHYKNKENLPYSNTSGYFFTAKK